MAWPPRAVASLRGKPSTSFLFFFFLKADSKAARLGSKGQEGVQRSSALSPGGRKAVPQAGWTRGGSAERCAGSPGQTGHRRSCQLLYL